MRDMLPGSTRFTLLRRLTLLACLTLLTLLIPSCDSGEEERAPRQPSSGEGSGSGADADRGAAAVSGTGALVLNELLVKGAGNDWIELANAGEAPLSLAEFTIADRLDEPERRVNFPEGTELAPGDYLILELDKEGWPGFAFSRAEGCGIWDAEGQLVDRAEWAPDEVIEEGSYGRIPDLSGDFQWSMEPSPGRANGDGDAPADE